ncbi:hypothetical protein BH11PLA1_BH11PLA1_21390 [soil metagenome]
MTTDPAPDLAPLPPPPLAGMGTSLPPRIPDRGSRTAAALAWVVLIAITLTTLILQQTKVFQSTPEAVPSAKPEHAETPKRELRAEHDYTPEDGGIRTLQYKLLMKMRDTGEVSEAIDHERANIAKGDDLSRTRLALVDAAVTSVKDPGHAAAPLDAAAEVVEVQILKQDLATASAIYAAGSLKAAQEAGLAGESIRGFRARHGVFADVALWYGDPQFADARFAQLSGGVFLITASIVLLGVVALAVAAGVVLLVVGLSGSFGRSLSSRAVSGLIPPAPGGSLPLETAAFFVLNFLVIEKWIPALLIDRDIPGVEIYGVLAPWLLTALVVAYPFLRGASWQEVRLAVGLHAGRGVAREMGIGILSWIATLPLMAAAIAVSLGAMLLYKFLTDGVEPRNPVAEMLTGLEGWHLVMLVLLLVVWAPFTEEFVFRGCLLRQLRIRLGPVLAGVLSALCFTIMHGYAFFLLLPVFTLGLSFALVRNWRGSLIPSMTAHALNNGLVAILLITLFKVILA